MSLLYGDNYIGQTTLVKSHTLCGLFMQNMVVDCKNMILPATSLTQRCYNSMFYGCTSLIAAPELPAKTLTDYCYHRMFSKCTKLNYIKCLATNISASECLSDWVMSVASTGTFVKAVGMTEWSTGTSGTPSGWTVVDDNS